MSRNSFHSTTANNSESESDEELKILSWKNAYEQQKHGSSPKFDKFRVQDYQDLQEDYYKIIEIASELIDYPKARTSPPHTRLPNVIPNNSNPPQPSTFMIPKVQPKSLISQLNFAKISNQLIKNPGTRSSALLLQALRLQLTKKRVITDALPTLIIFAEKDILLLKNKKNSVVATIVAQSESSSETKEELARFLNALS
uniref:Uncharacterized protein n=1 Tax=Panagrolaimus sp. PS1159 TaxID=55785 RepID=A0AC35FKL5_9BILA